MELEHLSYSSISTWLMCPRSWQYRYIDKVQVPTATALVFGSAIHDAIETRLRDRSLPMIEQWSDKWTSQIEKNAGIAWGNETPESLHNEGVRLLTSPEVIAAVDKIAPEQGETGARIEQRIELRVPDVPVPIIGFIDVMCDDGVPLDVKTSSKTWGADKARSETQPLFYLAALMQAGDHRHELRFRHLVIVKTKTPQVQFIESKFTFGNVFWLLEMVRTVWLAIEGGHFPCNPTGWKCSETWCEYWQLCRGKEV